MLPLIALLSRSSTRVFVFCLNRVIMRLIGFKVPIYDARRLDDFSVSKSLLSLEDLPLYEDGTCDVPAGSAVVVGYTVGAYKSRVPETLTLMTWSIRWVILLALPSQWETPNL